MKNVLLASVAATALFALATVGHAQQVSNAIVVSTCGTPPLTYTAGSPYPVTQDTTGKVCTSGTGGGGGGGAVYGPTATGSPSANPPVQIGGVDGSGNVQAARVDSTGNTYVFMPNLSASGSVTANGQSVQIATNGYGTVGFQVTGTWTGTFGIQASVDGVNWLSTNYVALTSGNPASSFSANTIGQINTAGMTYVRITSTAWTSGTATVSLQANQTVSNVMLESSLPSGTNTIGSVSASLGTTNGWTPKLLNALSTSVTSIKTSAGQLAMLQCYNPNSSPVYAQVFNVASGSVTLGSTTPTISIPISATATGGWALSNPGLNFSTAISIAITTTATGSTAPSTAADCNAAYN